MDRHQTIDRLWENSGHGTRREDIEAAYAAGEAAERERCARIVERISGWTGTREIAAEIRGETQMLKA